ncbi:hypothetical protein LPA49_13075 [Pseudoalteromonas sp. MB41]|uniref:GapS6a family protein n=1 Tax=Pseudoalteromonas sp. MB41 TaxID=2896366 RepID=UPI001E2B8761|nr:hypothetical protein [Pseudoalteromonas sp. MB41]MCC9661485.1 hypothetical protein [Pseudoalteromonas sp. MB41]
MGFLTASTLSGLIYDGVKEGASICFDLLKRKLKNWLIDDSEIEKIAELLIDAGINEDLAPHAIERKITEHQELNEFLKTIEYSGDIVNVTQSTNTGHNVYSAGSGNVRIGDVVANKGNS